MRNLLPIVVLAVSVLLSVNARSEGGVPRASGSIAPAVRTEVAAAYFNVKLSFWTSSHSRAAPVHVLITDESGATWLDQASYDAAMLTTLRPGSYTIAATYQGLRAVQDVRIAHNEQYLAHFSWSTESANGAVVSAIDQGVNRVTARSDSSP